MSQQRRFAYRLALELGHPYPDAMLARMSARTYLSWMEYAKEEPFGEERSDLRAGIIAATVANAFGGKKKGGSFSPQDFMPFSGKTKKKERRRKEATTDELVWKIRMINNLMGGKVRDQRKH